MNKLKKQFTILKIIYFIATVLLIAGLFYNTILPDWINNSLKVGFILLLIIELIINFKKIFLIILSILMILTSGLLFYSQYSIDKLLNHVPTETSIITFVVLKDSPINTLVDMKAKKVGMPIQLDDLIATYLKEYMVDNVSPSSLNIATDDLSNLDDLYSKKIDIMILDNSMRDSLIEQDANFESKTKTILTIEKSFIKEETAKNVDTSIKSFIILISGVDTRGTGPIRAKARSDVNILMVINPATHKVLTISIPRDTYTELGCQTGALDKLTHSGVYGISCTIKTIENLFKIDINYYVKVSFNSFLNIVNVLGKIDVYSKYAFSAATDTKPPVPFKVKVGMNTFNANQALTFSRERYAFVNGDVQRGLNQQEVIKSIIKKIVDPSTLLKIGDLISVASKSIDTNLTNENVMNLVHNQISKNVPWEFNSGALTGMGAYRPTYSMGSLPLYVMLPDLKLLAQLKNQITLSLNEKPGVLTQ